MKKISYICRHKCHFFYRIMNRFFVFSLMMFLVTVSVHAQNRFNYAEQWKTIDRLMDGILPQSALPEIEKVQQAALRDREYGQLVKAVMTRNTCLQLTEKQPMVAVINSLINDAKTIPFPAKAVIYSLTGEAFLNYYNQNRWALYDRTALSEDVENDNIETWDAFRLIREIVHYYRLSLSEPVLLQKASISNFKEALEGDVSTRFLRPTLYDFLAHRAIDAYMNNDLWMTDFSQPVVLNDPVSFDDAKSFVQMNVPETDTLAPAHLIMKVFRDLTAFRLTQSDINPLADVDLKRFNYLKERGNFDDVDALYEEAMKKLIESCAGQKIWGKVAYALATHYRQQGEEWSGKNLRKRRQYWIDAVSLCSEIEKKAPLMDDRKLAANMIREITRPEANLTIEKNLIPNQPALALVTYRNLHTAYLNIFSCQPDELEEFYQSNDWRDEMPQFLSKLGKIASQTLKLPSRSDYHQHSFEAKIDTLPAGSYLLVISDKPNPVKDKMTVTTFQSVQATNIKLLQRNHGDGKVEAYVVDALLGKPLPDAQLTMIRQIYDRELSKYTYIRGDSLQTVADGITLLPHSGNYRYNRIHISYGDDELTENMLNVFDGVEQPINSLRTVFFTDRAIYRPGQTVHFKGLLYETDYDGRNAIKTNAKTFVQLMDVNGKEISKQEFTTNEYGSFKGIFTLPQGLLNGMMNIRNEYGNVSIRVEEYKRPTFEVTTNPIDADYVLGDTVTVTGTAVALAGYPVDGAKVTFNVMRYQQFHPLWRMAHPPR